MSENTQEIIHYVMETSSDLINDRYNERRCMKIHEQEHKATWRITKEETSL